ncbi:hypothetical protein QCA50_009563 [Cerrena zonata]|uniref:Cryptic loci regulator 2 N-terminal domain-containing protein n=1 Tax=Cerrena zonata TaxID=2478898 RepID=A0AAW0GAW3_9APHY
MSSPILQTPYYTVSIHKHVVVVIELTQDATDATSDKRPSNIEKIVRDGTVNYYEEASPNTMNDWKKKLGKLLVDNVVKPQMESWGDKFKYKAKSFILLDFPGNYKLYHHYKGDQHIPRKDTYLIGSEHVAQFRSPYEFFLHVKWLMEGKPLKPDSTPACGCCYCDTSVTQSDISKRYNLGHISHKPKKKGRAPRPETAIPIPYKDYTKLNQSASTSAT